MERNMATPKTNFSRAPARPRSAARVPRYPTLCAAAVLIACGGNVAGVSSRDAHEASSTGGYFGDPAGGIGEPFTGGTGGVAGATGGTGGTTTGGFGNPT